MCAWDLPRPQPQLPLLWMPVLAETVLARQCHGRAALDSMHDPSAAGLFRSAFWRVALARSLAPALQAQNRENSVVVAGDIVRQRGSESVRLAARSAANFCLRATEQTRQCSSCRAGVAFLLTPGRAILSGTTLATREYAFARRTAGRAACRSDAGADPRDVRCACPCRHLPPPAPPGRHHWDAALARCGPQAADDKR